MGIDGFMQANFNAINNHKVELYKYLYYKNTSIIMKVLGMDRKFDWLPCFLS